MPTDEQRQIASAIKDAIENLKDADPEQGVPAADFNALLAQTMMAFPNLVGVQNVTPLEGGANIGQLKFKLSLLHGPIKAFLRLKAASIAAPAPIRRVAHSPYLLRNDF